MTELAVLGVLGTAVSLIKTIIQKRGALKVIGDSAGGGVIEELVEELIESFTGVINSKKRSIKALIVDMQSYIQKLNPKQQSAIVDFFLKHSVVIEGRIKNKTSKSTKSETKLDIDVDAVLKLRKDELENFKKSSEFKKLAKQLKKLYDVAKKQQEKTIGFVTTQKAAEALFPLNEGEIYPDELLGLLDVLLAHIRNITYLSLGEEDQKFAKVFQYMLENNTEELKKWFNENIDLSSFQKMQESFKNELKDEIVLILQQHASGALTSAVTIEKARKDPFCFVKLVCPDCHATGEYIVRKGDRAYCKKCGNEYYVTENIEELKPILLEVKKEIIDKLGVENEETRGLFKAEIERVSHKIVTVEYFDKKFKELQENQKNQKFDMSEFFSKAEDITEDFKQVIEARIENEMEKMQAYLQAVLGKEDELKELVQEAVKGGEDIRVSVADIRFALEQSSDRMETITDALQSGIRCLCEDSEQIKAALSGLEVKTDRIILGIEDLKYSNQELIRMFSEFKDKEGSRLQWNSKTDKIFIALEKFINEYNSMERKKTYNRSCPYCENETEFKELNDAHYYCNICGYSICEDNISLDPNIVLENDDVVVASFKCVGGVAMLTPDDPRAVSEMNDAAQLRLKIILNSATPWVKLRNEGFNLNVTLKEKTIKSISFVSETETYLNFQILQKVFNDEHLSNCLKTVVIGKQVVLNSLQTSQLPAKWKYNKDNELFQKKNRRGEK